MKLKVPALYSQRDSQWSSVILGNNPPTAVDQYNHPYNLYWYACLISCLGMYVGKNPQQINTILTPNGFQKDNGVFIWSQSTLLGLTQTYLSPRYEAAVTAQGLQKIKDLLDAGFPLVCEIDFNPNTQGEEQHYVLINGYEGDKIFACDPWTGTQIDLDLYGGPARAILQFRAYDKKLDQDTVVSVETQITQLREERDRNWNWFVAVCNALKTGANVDTAVAEATKLLTIEQAVLDKDRQLADVQKKANDLEAQLSQKDKDIQSVRDQATTLTVEIGKLQQEVDALTKRNQEDLQQIKDLQDAAKITQSLTGFRKVIFDLFFRR